MSDHEDELDEDEPERHPKHGKRVTSPTYEHGTETFQERVRFALALQGSEWAHTALPPSWVLMQTAPGVKFQEWRDTAARNRVVPKEAVREAITTEVENAFGFTPTRTELDFLLVQCVTPARSTDAVHKFMRECFTPCLGSDIDLGTVWDRWRIWKPSQRPRMPELAFREVLKERGYPVVMTSDDEGVIRGWKRKPKVLSVGYPKRKGRPKDEA